MKSVAKIKSTSPWNANGEDLIRIQRWSCHMRGVETKKERKLKENGQGGETGEEIDVGR